MRWVPVVGKILQCHVSYLTELLQRWKVTNDIVVTVVHYNIERPLVIIAFIFGSTTIWRQILHFLIHYTYLTALVTNVLHSSCLSL